MFGLQFCVWPQLTSVPHPTFLSVALLLRAASRLELY
jgi:hypothetical protein